VPHAKLLRKRRANLDPQEPASASSLAAGQARRLPGKEKIRPKSRTVSSSRVTPAGRQRQGRAATREFPGGAAAARQRSSMSERVRPRQGCCRSEQIGHALITALWHRHQRRFSRSKNCAITRSSLMTGRRRPTGAHIRTLLLTFFYRQMRAIIGWRAISISPKPPPAL